MNKYSEEFRWGLCPRTSVLLGPLGMSMIWRVRMLSGLLPDLSGIGHVKECSGAGGVMTRYIVAGHNQLAWGPHWGHFTASLAEAPDGRSALLLDYSCHERNGFFTSRIRDYIRVADDLSLIGQFRWMLGGRARLLGYFRLEHIRG